MSASKPAQNSLTLQPKFYPWLFSDRAAWEKTIADARWTYDLPMDWFMAIYQEYRSGTPASPLTQTKVVTATASSPAKAPSGNSKKTESSASTSGAGQILGQSEIDALLASMKT